MEKILRINPPNIGWLEVDLEKDEIDYLWSIIEEANNRDSRITNKELAGNISLSRELNDRDDMWFDRVLTPLITKYEQEFQYSSRSAGSTSQIHPYYLQSFWVNYQYQTEFNPIHNHTGKYSFVIWLKIPTKWEEQSQLPISKNSNAGSISNFAFRYADILGHSTGYTYYMDPVLEGKMLFFDAELQHMVYPFYQNDGERVSISGNIALETKIALADTRRDMKIPSKDPYFTTPVKEDYVPPEPKKQQ